MRANDRVHRHRLRLAGQADTQATFGTDHGGDFARQAYGDEQELRNTTSVNGFVLEFPSFKAFGRFSPTNFGSCDRDLAQPVETEAFAQRSVKIPAPDLSAINVPGLRIGDHSFKVCVLPIQI